MGRARILAVSQDGATDYDSLTTVASNFTVADLIGVAEAFFLFPLFTLIPGYVCGWLLDAFGFRRRTLPARLAASIALSIGVSPILAYLLWRWSILAVWAGFGALWIGFIVLAFYERHIWFSGQPVSRRRIAFIGIAAGWIVLGTFSLIDLQFKDRLYFSLVSYDYTFRTAVTSAITRVGIPPHNPYFFPGRPFVLRYHYFLFILCSLVNQIGAASVSPRQALIAGTLWCGLGLLALIPLYLRFFQPKGAANLDQRMLLGIGLLSVTGLNILPVAVFDVFSRNFILTNLAVVPWADQVLWAPHHVAALTACLTGFLLIWYRRERQGWSGDLLTSLGAGIMFAGGFGLSVYVTLVVAVSLTVWVAVAAIRGEFREVGMTCLAGVAALAVCSPYILELLGGGSKQSAGGGRLLQLAVRTFPITDILISSAHMADWLRSLASALVLPWNYFFDLGFFFLIGVLQCRRLRAAKTSPVSAELCGLILAASGLLVCTFVRSGVIAVNDLALRGFMVVQFVVLIWGAEFLAGGLVSPRARKLLAGTLVLGVAGTVYDVCMLRVFPIIGDNSDIPRHQWLAPDHNIGGRTYALRQLYESLKSSVPPDAVLQHNPDVDPGDLPHGLYADRQIAAEGLQCGAVFGGDPLLCEQIIGRITGLFEKPEAIAADQVDAICKDLSIDVLVVKDTDPAWADKNSWVWSRSPVIANRYARAFLCGRSLAAHP